MHHLNGCTECFTVWWACRCPLRCEECGAGYRDDGNSNCGTPGCQVGQRRSWAMQDRWDREFSGEPAGPVPAPRCEAVADPAPRPRATPRPDKLVARPVAQRRADIVALPDEGLSDRAIARRVKVSPSTVGAVRREQAREAAKNGP